jgi:hypothetical protein
VQPPPADSELWSVSDHPRGWPVTEGGDQSAAGAGEPSSRRLASEAQAPGWAIACR